MAFKMKGSPLHRNFESGSPIEQNEKWIDRADTKRNRLTTRINRAKRKGKTEKVEKLTRKRGEHFKKTIDRMKNN